LVASQHNGSPFSPRRVILLAQGRELELLAISLIKGRRAWDADAPNLKILLKNHTYLQQLVR